MLLDGLTDVVTVYHCDENYQLHLDLIDQITEHEPNSVNIFGVDNRIHNRGFAAACNLGAALGEAPVIGFLNPDTAVEGAFADIVHAMFHADNRLVITGSNFGKKRKEIQLWGCRDWVCGAALFVRREWWESVGGFDTIYRWSWEETDLIRRAQAAGKKVRSIELPFKHESPNDNTPEDARYKNYWFEHGARVFKKRWQS